MHKGYDASKKVSGIKRHLVVDTLGLPHALVVTTADVTDRAESISISLFSRAGHPCQIDHPLPKERLFHQTTFPVR